MYGRLLKQQAMDEPVKWCVDEFRPVPSCDSTHPIVRPDPSHQANLPIPSSDPSDPFHHATRTIPLCDDLSHHATRPIPSCDPTHPIMRLDPSHRATRLDSLDEEPSGLVVALLCRGLAPYARLAAHRACGELSSKAGRERKRAQQEQDTGQARRRTRTTGDER